MKIDRYILLLILFFGISVFGAETPTKDISVGDMVDKQLPKMDKKIWQNFLGFYANVRMIAKTTLQDMQAVANFAWSAERQLQSIENASKRIDQIYTAIQNYRGDNPVDFIMFAELKVFRQADALKDYDIPMIVESNQAMKKSRDEIVNLGKDQAKAVAEVSVKTYKWFEAKFKYTESRSLPDLRTIDIANPRPGQKAAFMLGAATSEQLAGADIRNQQLQNQNAMLSAMVNATNGNSGDIPTKAGAGMIKDNNRNNLLLTLQENDIQNAAISNESWYLLIKARELDQEIVAKSLMVTCATAFTQELNKVKSESRFVNRK